jgi:dGTPase
LKNKIGDKLEWKKLLSGRLLGTQDNYIFDDGRSQYQRDFDRIVFCSAFRRLQDKTQVFPLPESDFVHTRLTHSLEVSCVGRSLGNIVGKVIIERHPELAAYYHNYNFGEIVSAACLAHDIGNPPFGHSGEDAISEYFKNGAGQQFHERINEEKKWNDLVMFEGNAQGFRIISKLQNPNIIGGLRLTYATLSAFTKYPKESTIPKKTDTSQIKGKIYKKFGFFQSEADLFRLIAEETGLGKRENDDDILWWQRHPLAFLVEAADDICYRIMDLEDGYRLGLLSYKETYDLLYPIIRNEELRSFDERNQNDKIGYLRAKAINSLIKEITEVFLDQEEKIMKGELETDLLSMVGSSEPLETIKKISVEKIYSYSSVVERESAGFEVLAGLLDTFIKAVNDLAEGKKSAKSTNHIKLFPNQFTDENGQPEEDLYLRLLNIIDFVSGMTDSYAVSLFRRIKGIALPGK